MTIGINCGHTVSGAGYGAVGIIKESEQGWWGRPLWLCFNQQASPLWIVR